MFFPFEIHVADRKNSPQNVGIWVRFGEHIWRVNVIKNEQTASEMFIIATFFCRSHTFTNTHIHTRTHARTHTHARTFTNTHTHSHTLTLSTTHTRTHTRTHTHASDGQGGDDRAKRASRLH